MILARRQCNPYSRQAERFSELSGVSGVEQEERRRHDHKLANSLPRDLNWNCGERPLHGCIILRISPTCDDSAIWARQPTGGSRLVSEHESPSGTNIDRACYANDVTGAIVVTGGRGRRIPAKLSRESATVRWHIDPAPIPEQRFGQKQEGAPIGIRPVILCHAGPTMMCVAVQRLSSVARNKIRARARHAPSATPCQLQRFVMRSRAASTAWAPRWRCVPYRSAGRRLCAIDIAGPIPERTPARQNPRARKSES